MHTSLGCLRTCSNYATCVLLLSSLCYLPQDISNLRDFFEVNLEMTRPGSPISVFDVEETIVSRGHILPPAMIHNCEIKHTLVGEGSALRVSLGSAWTLTAPAKKPSTGRLPCKCHSVPHRQCRVLWPSQHAVTLFLCPRVLSPTVACRHLKYVCLLSP